MQGSRVINCIHFMNKSYIRHTSGSSSIIGIDSSALPVADIFAFELSFENEIPQLALTHQVTEYISRDDRLYSKTFYCSKFHALMFHQSK